MEDTAQILVIDSASHQLCDTARLLRGAGYRVVEAATGAAALRQVRLHKPDLVLLDVALPDVDGAEVCRRVKADPACRDCYVALLLASETTPGCQEDEFDAGADEYIARPIQGRELLARVRALLRVRRAELALREARSELEARAEQPAAALARANSALEQRAEELSVLNTVSHLVSTSLSIDRVVEAALEGIVTRVAPDLAMLCLRDGDELRLKSIHPTDPTSSLFQHTTHRVGECLCGLAAKEKVPCYSHDIHADPRCTLSECKKAGLRSFVALPLLSGDQVLGVLGVASTTGQQFEEQSAFWEALAAEIAMGVRNARLHQEVQHHVAALQKQITERRDVETALRNRNRELALLNRSAQAFSSSLDSERVLASILEEVRRLLDVVACSVWLFEPDGVQLVCRESAGRGGEVVRGWRLGLGEGIVGWVAQNGHSLNILDARVDERHLSEIDRLVGIDLRSILAVPLQIQGRIIGTLEVLDEAPGRFGETDVTLLELLAASAANAVEHAQLYERLEHARREWEEIFQAIGHPTLILDSEHTILAANRAALSATANMTEGLVGKKCHEVFHNADQPTQCCPVAETLAAPLVENVSVGHLGTAEIEMEALGGTFLVSCTPVVDDGGRLQQIIHIATDITDLKRAEQSLQESRLALERRNQDLTVLNAVATTISQALNLDQMLTGVLDRALELTRVDAGWIRLLDVDQEALVLAAHRGLSQETIDELEATAASQSRSDLMLQSGQPFVVAERSVEPSIGIEGLLSMASYTWVGIPIQARDRILGVLNVLSMSPQEITQEEMQLLGAIGHQIGVAVENLRLRQGASEAHLLRELDILRSELIANASHELRTPLGLVRIFATALLMEEVEFDSETHRQFLVGIEDETAKLEGIVDNLLDLSRMEGGRLDLELAPADLGRLVKAATKAMEPELQDHRFVTELESEPLEAVVDAKRIEQVLRNLLSNAIKYSPGGGTITVQATRGPDEVSICVRDQGIGIPKEEQQRIFERFYRVDNDTTRRTRGVGLGLSICRWIIEAHGGQVRVQSALGEGSTFCLVLPADGKKGKGA